MVINDWIHTLAGFFIMLSLALGVDCGFNPIFVHKYFLFFTLFVGANLFQYGFTKFCPLGLILKKLGKSCMHCHDDYQTITTLLYRSADFSRQTVVKRQTQKTVDYDDVMEELSDAVNRLNIAIKDGYFDTALDNLKPVKEQLADLSDSCSNCHKKDKVPVQRIIGAADELLPQLEQQLKAADKSQSGRKLGEFAVKVCARCHAVHRLSSDLKAIME